MFYVLLAMGLQVVGFLSVMRIAKQRASIYPGARDSSVPRDFDTLDADEKDLP